MTTSSLEKQLQTWFWWLLPIYYLPILLLHGLLRGLREQVWFIMHPFWPLSVFSLKLPILIDALTLVAVGIVGLFLIRNLNVANRFMAKLLILGAVLLITTNLLQGVELGLVRPVHHSSEFAVDYWSDSLTVHSVSEYLQSYTLYQPTMGYHARVHPPLAVLWFWGLRQVWDVPIFVGLILMTLTLLSLPLLYRWTLEHSSEKTARFIVTALLLMPAFQIYGYASLDGVIMTLMLATLYFFHRLQTKLDWAMAVVSASLVFGLTFGAVWLVPVIFLISVLEHKNVRQAIYFFILLGVMGMLVNYVAGYNYLESFWIGRSYEGFRGGFYGFVQPVSYVVTRIQDILEPLVFYGPYFTVLTFLSLKRFGRSKPETRILLSGMVALLIFLLAGAYYTGETARAALFMLSLMLLATTPLLHQESLSRGMKSKLLMMVILQTVLMQLFGDYYW